MKVEKLAEAEGIREKRKENPTSNHFDFDYYFQTENQDLSVEFQIYNVVKVVARTDIRITVIFCLGKDAINKSLNDSFLQGKNKKIQKIKKIGNNNWSRMDGTMLKLHFYFFLRSCYKFFLQNFLLTTHNKRRGSRADIL